MADIPAGPAAETVDGQRRNGDANEFETLVRRYSAFIYSVCYRTTGNRHDAEDAAQIAFLQLAIALKRGTVIDRPAAWLERVARRQGLRLIRTHSRARRRDLVASKPEMQLSSHPETMDQVAIAGLVRDQIDSLPERYRLPLVLHYFGGMSLDTIAGELKINPQTIGESYEYFAVGGVPSAVQVAAAIPEPAGFVMSLGVLLLCSLRRRKNASRRSV
jgi:RNA polymerase sigma factor (sigma-70 family)